MLMHSASSNLPPMGSVKSPCNGAQTCCHKEPHCKQLPVQCRASQSAQCQSMSCLQRVLPRPVMVLTPSAMPHQTAGHCPRWQPGRPQLLPLALLHPPHREQEHNNLCVSACSPAARRSAYQSNPSSMRSRPCAQSHSELSTSCSRPGVAHLVSALFSKVASTLTFSIHAVTPCLRAVRRRMKQSQPSPIWSVTIAETTVHAP